MNSIHATGPINQLLRNAQTITHAEARLDHKFLTRVQGLKRIMATCSCRCCGVKIDHETAVWNNHECNDCAAVTQ